MTKIYVKMTTPSFQWTATFPHTVLAEQCAECPLNFICSTDVIPGSQSCIDCRNMIEVA